MIEIGTKVIINKVPSPMYEGFIGKEAKAAEKKGDVSGNQQFLVDGTKAIYLPEDHVSLA
jgi:hypothetical protein